MQVPQILEKLAEQGIEVWAEQDKLKVRSPRGGLCAELRTLIAERKMDILNFLQATSRELVAVDQAREIELDTIGRLLAGLAAEAQATFRPPVTDPKAMATRLVVTFRPLPDATEHDPHVLRLREALAERLVALGVRIEPWEQATREFAGDFMHQVTNGATRVRVVRSGISAVISTESPQTPAASARSALSEQLYAEYVRTTCNGQKPSAAKISQFIGWAEGSGQPLEDPTNTQIITLAPLDPLLSDTTIPYKDKIPLGVSTLVRNFSEIVIGVSPTRLSILNMNLSDSTFDIEELDRFIFQSLIPKIYVPILPLPLSRFAMGRYDPAASPYAARLVELGRALAPTGLLPSGFRIDAVIERQSHRDIVDWMVSGRTGVSYGFVAFLEPPRYVGDIEISADGWQQLGPVAGFRYDELRCNDQGRRYVPIRRGQVLAYRQLPDIWLVCSRSGANKTDLQLTTDVLRVGLSDRLHLELPQDIDTAADIKPSYDIYVMVAIALAGALYTPTLVEAGAALVHFHGYVAPEWFTAQPGAYCVGMHNPSVPCGTYESGVFNFLGLRSLAEQQPTLVGLVEPDHGINLVCPDPRLLTQRLQAGIDSDLVELGGRHFPALRRYFESGADR